MTRLPLDQDIHPIPVKEGNSKGSAFCIVSSTQVARQVIAELDGKYTIPGFSGIAPVNVKVSFFSDSLAVLLPTFFFQVAENDQEKAIRKSGGGSQYAPYAFFFVFLEHAIDSS